MHLVFMLMLLACTSSAPVDDTSDTDTDTDTDSDTDTDTDTDSDTDTASGDECVFNADCPANERCGCDEATGCFCEHGERGTGVNGVDTCVDENDCASALCVEGQNDVFYCSDECVNEADCGPNLPVCATIAFVGRICIRETPE